MELRSGVAALDTAFSLMDLIQVLAQNKRKAVLLVVGPGLTGRVVLDEGRLVHAELDRKGASQGEAALMEMLTWHNPEVRLAAWPEVGVPQTMLGPTTEILLRILQEIDETQNKHVFGDGRVPTPKCEEGAVMEGALQELVREMKNRVPGALATAFFSVTDGLMLAVDSDIPDTNVEAMSAIHDRIWGRIQQFMTGLPPEIAGRLSSATLEVEGASFYLSVDEGAQLAGMGAFGEGGSLGLTRLVVDRYVEKAADVLKV